MEERITADIIHDVNQPLTAGSGFLELALKNYGDGLEPPLQRMLKLSLYAYHDAMQILENSLEMARLKSQGLELTLGPVAGGPMLDELCVFYGAHAQAKGVALSFENAAGGSMVLGDTTMLKRLYRNILHNAVKFTPTGGRVMVRAGEEDDFLVVTVCDTGRGIPKDELRKLGIPFRQALPEDRAQGHGLGLGVCKAVTEAHDGEWLIRSEYGVGTEVTVRLPLAAAE